MAKINLNIPSLGSKFVDLRDSLPGDAYNWNWKRDLSQIEYLAIHHSCTDINYTPFQIARDHINKNGWGGIGYHFVVDKDGVVYYTGDITTARANVANLNEQVLGICLIGNFIGGEIPFFEQLDSVHKLCEFFIKSQDLPNVTSWDKLRGHKELPNQATNCPGDNWPSLRIKIVEGVTMDEQFVREEVLELSENEKLKSQIESLQTNLASLNQQAIFLQETLQEREKEIQTLKMGPVDNTLTIIGALVNLYKSFFPPGKETPI